MNELVNIISEVRKYIKKPDIVYHVSNTKNKKSILEKGLIPNKNDYIKHGRIYFSVDMNGAIEVADWFVDFNNMKSVTIFKINIKPLKNVKFYLDPMTSAGWAIYTQSPIPKEYIEIVKDNYTLDSAQ